jgi:HSP20 family protein
MALVRWDPGRELDSLQSEVNRLFDTFFGNGGRESRMRRWVPAMDLAETDNERAFGSFSRSLSLPEGVDADKLSANFDKGVLEVRVPKPEERKPHRVAIAGGDVNGKATEK